MAASGIFIVGAKRTAFGSFGGSLSRLRYWVQGSAERLSRSDVMCVAFRFDRTPKYEGSLLFSANGANHSTVVCSCHSSKSLSRCVSLSLASHPQGLRTRGLSFTG